MKKLIIIVLLAAWLPCFAQQDSTKTIVADSTPAPIGYEAHPLKRADQLLPRFCIDINLKGGLMMQDINAVNLYSAYPDAINTHGDDPKLKFTKGEEYGFDAQFALFFGKYRHWGLGTGILYLFQNGNLKISDPNETSINVAFNSTAVPPGTTGNFRQIISSTNAISETMNMTNVNIPLLLKYKYQFYNKHGISRFGVTADAGGLFNVQLKNNYNTNAVFNYEAIYKFNGNTAVYDNSLIPSTNDVFYTQDAVKTALKNSDQTVLNYFNAARSQGYNVGLNQTPTTPKGTTSYSVGSTFGGLAQLGLSYQLSYRVTLNFGGYFFYQMLNNTDKNVNNYQITNKVGDYSSLTNAVKSSTNMSAGANLGIRMYIGKARDIDGDGIADKYDNCPEVWADPKHGRNGCPDSDDDGVLDKDDSCKYEPGSALANGCPDMDGDGIADKDDECIDLMGIAEYHGCPTARETKIGKEVLGSVRIVRDTIRLGEVPHYVLSSSVINFAFGKADISPSAYPAIDSAVDLLKKDSKIIISVSGYTDDIGKYENNILLSVARANAINKYLQSKGISKNRIILSGYGNADPISENKTDEDRAKNRRIEMKLLLPL